MKTLIVEDDFTSRLLLQEILNVYGDVHIAVNGREAVEAVRSALDAEVPYDLVCLDIMMPEMDGLTALNQIRGMEEAAGAVFPRRARIVMTTALRDESNVMAALHGRCEDYVGKPIRRAALLERIRALGLIA